MKPKYGRLHDSESKGNPKGNASIFSILSFSWVRGILKTGYKRPLEMDDLFPLLDEDKTQTSTEKLERTWNEEITRHPPNKTGRRHRLFRALVRMFPWTYHMFVLSTALLSGVGNVLQAVFLSLLLHELMKPSSNDFKWAYVYAAGICLSSFIRVLLRHHFSYNAWLTSVRWKSAVIGIVLRKVLILRQVNLLKITSGHIINLIAGDLQRFDLTVDLIGVFIQALFELSCVSFLVVYMFEWKALSGVAFMVFLSLYYGVMGNACAEIRSKICEVADSRLNIINSIISGIRAVKMYAWEWPFFERVRGIRRREVQLIRWKTAILASFASFSYSSQSIAACISLATLAATGTVLTPYTTFMILSFVSILRMAVSINISCAVNGLADFSAALTRIQSFLEFDDASSHELLQRAFLEKESNDLKGKENETMGNLTVTKSMNNVDSLICFSLKREKIQPESQFQLRLQNVACSWSGDIHKPTLTSLCLSIHKGDLVFVTGPVGCGKSSLLFTILQELPVLKGLLSCHGNVAYVGQQPWVFSGTVRDNILFGQPFNPLRYSMVLEACDLHKDIQRFPDGDSTRVGERGTVLSGGQRARVGLARAVYSDADVYLLDDPLSAVDLTVGQHIFKMCINGALGKKTRLVVTHNLQFLKDADEIVVMKEGSIQGRGDYHTLLKCGFELDNLERAQSVDTMDTRAVVQHDMIDENAMDKENVMESIEEGRLRGSVSWKLYWEYIQAGTNAASSAALALFFIIVQGALIAPDWWLLVLTDPSRDQQQQTRDFYIYGGLVGGALLLSITRAAIFLNVSLNSSQHLHDSMMLAVLKAPVRFFDTNPVGRVLNRFSRDIGIMDDLLPETFLDALQMMLFCIGAIILPSVLNPWIILAAAPLVVVFVLIGRYYLKTSRDLRRLEAVSRSPVLAHFSDTLDGLVTIRAYQREDAFLEELFRHQDCHNQTWFSILSTIRWLGIRLDMICVIFIAVVVFLAIATQSGPGITALSLVYSLQLAVDTSQYGVRQCTDVENYMTSVERIISYTRIEEETGYQNQSQPPENWPQHGEVKVKSLCLDYFQGGPKILKDVTFTITPCEKVGIAGRTGAGKSSIVAALFRMPQPTGDIIIDGVNINRINIQSSRRVMSVITQNPVLFTGSLRMNLDPFEEHPDKDIWDALDDSSLKTMVEKLPRQLSEEINECGANFSVGERQLLCLARAMLKKSKIIVMDEATANVDYKTDEMIQETIRTKCSDCTVITIAHRLNTIMDYDRVLVLDNGRVVEYDKPQNLLQKKGGHFSHFYRSHEDSAF